MLNDDIIILKNGRIPTQGLSVALISVLLLFTLINTSRTLYISYNNAKNFFGF